MCILITLLEVNVLGGPGFLLSCFSLPPLQKSHNQKIRKSQNGASEMISVRTIAARITEMGNMENSFFEGCHSNKNLSRLKEILEAINSA